MDGGRFGAGWCFELDWLASGWLIQLFSWVDWLRRSGCWGVRVVLLGFRRLLWGSCCFLAAQGRTYRRAFLHEGFRELHGLDLCIFVTLQLHLHFLGVFQVVQQDLTSHSSDCHRMSITRESQLSQRNSRIYLLDFPDVINIIESDSIVLSSRT